MKVIKYIIKIEPIPNFKINIEKNIMAFRMLYFSFLPTELNFIILSKLKYTDNLYDELKFICGITSNSICSDDRLWKSLFMNEYPLLLHHLSAILRTQKVDDHFYMNLYNLISTLKYIEEVGVPDLYEYLIREENFDERNIKILAGKFRNAFVKILPNFVFNTFYKMMLYDVYSAIYFKVVNFIDFKGNEKKYIDEIFETKRDSMYEILYMGDGSLKLPDINSYITIVINLLNQKRILIPWLILEDVNLNDKNLIFNDVIYLINILADISESNRGTQLQRLVYIFIDKILKENKELYTYLYELIYFDQEYMENFKNATYILYDYFQRLKTEGRLPSFIYNK